MRKLKTGQIITVKVGDKIVKAEYLRMNQEFYVVYPLDNSIICGVKRTVVVNLDEIIK